MQQRVFSFLIDDNLQTYSKDTKKKNEKCSDITAETMVEKGKFCNSLQHESSRDGVSFPHPLGAAKEWRLWGVNLGKKRSIWTKRDPVWAKSGQKCAKIGQKNPSSTHPSRALLSPITPFRNQRQSAIWSICCWEASLTGPQTARQWPAGGSSARRLQRLAPSVALPWDALVICPHCAGRAKPAVGPTRRGYCHGWPLITIFETCLVRKRFFFGKRAKTEWNHFFKLGSIVDNNGSFITCNNAVVSDVRCNDT